LPGAGCGKDRSSDWDTPEGAIGGIAIDLDERSLASARRYLSPHSSVEIRYQSIRDITECEARSAFSIGVNHHLAEPERDLRRMALAVRREGYVLIWI